MLGKLILDLVGVLGVLGLGVEQPINAKTAPNAMDKESAFTIYSLIVYSLNTPRLAQMKYSNTLYPNYWQRPKQYCV